MNRDYLTPLLTATKFNSLGCVTVLVEKYNANIHCVDNNMWNVLHHSIENENAQLIKFFMSKDKT